MSEKKRKSSSRDSERPSKKHQLEGSVKVRHVAGSDIAKPIVALSPGTSFPDVKFQPFTKSTSGRTNLLLQSSDHPALNHTARENDSSTRNHLKHYVAVFDPKTGKLQMTEARHMTVRSSLRSANPVQEEEEIGNTPVTNYTSRSALTAAFGTKKSKKAVQSMTENRLLAQADEDVNNTMSTAMLSNIPEDEIITNEVPLAEALSNKPLPPANLRTNEIDQVYSLNALVLPKPSSTTLEAMPINTWSARIASKKEVKSRSRIVANRVGYLVSQMLSTEGGYDPKLNKAVQVLRYIQLLLDIHSYVSKLPRRKPLPNVEDWPENTMSEGTPMSFIRPIVKHFFPDRTPKEQSLTLLRTTVLALALHIPPPSGNAGLGQLISEPTDLSLDMAIEGNEIRKLYRELGCHLAPAKDNELSMWGLERLGKRKKDESGGVIPKPTFARLKFPLDFPKLSRGRQSARR